MNGLVEKLDSFQILTNLLPGLFFRYALRLILGIDIPMDGIVEEMVLCYFIGLMIGRIGSVIIEPIVRKFKLVKYAPYGDFVAIEKEDHKLSVLSTMNIFYRSLLAATLLLLVMYGFIHLERIRRIVILIWQPFVIILLCMIFFGSYKKQTNTIRKRIEKQLNK